MSHPQSESIGGYLGYIPRQGYSRYISGILLISLEYPLGYLGAMCGEHLSPDNALEPLVMLCDLSGNSVRAYPGDIVFARMFLEYSAS